MSRCFCRVYFLSTHTDKITSLHQNYQCDGSVEFNNSSIVGNFKVLSHYCTSAVLYCIYARDVTDISRNTASKVDIYLGRLLLVGKLAMLRDRDTEALCSPVRTAVLQQNVLAKSLDKQYEITYSTTVCWTLQ